jgi:hypothetical protein
MLHVFMLRAPVIDVAFVTVSVPRVAVPVTPALLVTVRELRVVVPVGTLNDPLDTVTFPPVDGLSTILEVADIWTLHPELIAIEPSSIVTPEPGMTDG